MPKALKSVLIVLGIVLAILVALHVAAPAMMGSLAETIHGHR